MAVSDLHRGAAFLRRSSNCDRRTYGRIRARVRHSPKIADDILSSKAHSGTPESRHPTQQRRTSTINSDSGGVGRPVSSGEKARKSLVLAILLCAFLGVLGAHRFYLDQPKWGYLYLGTFACGGIFVVWDLLLFFFCQVSDNEGRLLTYNNDPVLQGILSRSSSRPMSPPI